MRIAICDDDIVYREQILTMTKAYALQNTDVCFSSFSNANELLEAVNKSNYFDIYVLDVVMPGINGIELGTELRRKDCDGKIIYLTSSEEYAIDSFKVKPFDYIIKPVKKDTFFSTLDDAILSISNQKEKNIIVKTKDSSVKLKFDSIMYAELSRRCIVYHLTNGETLTSLSIRTSFSESIQELLDDKRFVLCSASMIANMHHITAIENDALIFKEKYKAYLGVRACRSVRTAWYDYCFEEESQK